MVTPDSTMMIDPEFAYVGPMAFDVGKLLGNLLLALFAIDGHDADGSRAEQRAWVAGSVVQFWNTFSRRWACELAPVQRTSTPAPPGDEPPPPPLPPGAPRRFLELWGASAAQPGGDLLPVQLAGGSAPEAGATLALVQAAYMAALYDDALRFAGGRAGI
jgi:hypothetical protein